MVSIIYLTNNNIDNYKQKICNYLNTEMQKMGVTIDNLIVTKYSYDLIKSLSKTEDFLIILSDQNFIENNKSLAKILGVELVKDEDVFRHISAFNESGGILSNIQNQLCYLPINAVPMLNKNNENVGWIYDSNCLMAFMPDDIDFVDYCFNKIIKVILNQKINLLETSVVKTFGLLEKDIKSRIMDFIPKEININLLSDGLDVTIYITYNKNIQQMVLQDVISKIYTKLNKFIYADEDVTIFERASDLLKLSNLSLSIVETITAGNVSKNMALVDAKLNDCFVCLDRDCLIRQLKVATLSIKKFGHISVEVAYEGLSNLLDITPSSIGLFILGDKNNNTSYVAIGDVDGIHVYKNALQGNLSEQIDALTKSGIFYLIKKLKQNTLLFMESKIE